MGLGLLWLGYFIKREEFIELFLIYSVLFLGLGFIYLFFSRSWIVIFLFGAAIRLSLLLTIPSLSDDYARFLWDGELTEKGQNPYLETPKEWTENHPDLYSPYMENLLDLMNSPEYYSVYPPANQVVFWIGAKAAEMDPWTGIVGLRIILVLAEFALFFLMLALFRKLDVPIQRLSLYWLNPLVILELTVNLHFEGLVLLFLFAALFFLGKNKYLLSGASWGMAIGMKLLPLMLFPSLFTFKKTQKSGLFWSGAIMACLLAFGGLLSEGSWINFLKSIQLYQGKFEYNASIYYLFREVGFWIKGYNTIATLTKILSLLTFVGIIWISWKQNTRNLIELSTLWMLLFLGYLLLQPIVHPWYIIPALGLSILNRSYVLLLWSFTSILSYQAYQNLDFYENPWLLALEYLPVFFLIFTEFKSGKLSWKKPTPSSIA